MQFMKQLVLVFFVFLVSVGVAWASERGYQLVAGRDNKLCARVLDAFREDVDDRGRLRYQHEIFRQVIWKPVELSGQGPKTRHCSSLDKALVDLDNDGQQDLVVKTTFCMKGSPSDSFYVFPADSTALEQANWQDLSPLSATADKFERTGGSYPLSTFPMSSESSKERPALNTVFTVQLLIMDGKTYVVLTDGRGQWTVIATYLRGERFEDQCYLQMASK
ncbi:MAG: hypothetical protein ABI988_07295 [Nitrospirota bacterium]